MFYFDSAATTKPYPSVVEVVKACMEETWGNASSAYQIGKNAKMKIEAVREQIADDINCDPDEIIFTSGACEANSLIIHNADKIFTTNLEHKSVLLAAENCNQAIYFKNDKYGNVLQHDFIQQIKNATSGDIVSVCAANGEIGTVQNIAELRSLTPTNIMFHTDATQLFPQQRINVKEWNIDAMSVSGQKFHAPKGVGFLYVKSGYNLKPIIYGTQENKLRGGTYNTPLICGLGEALRITRNKKQIDNAHRDVMLRALLQIDGVELVGAPVHKNRLKNNLTIKINNVPSEMLITLADLHGICISSGSACNTGIPEPSRAYLALGFTPKETNNIIRITWDEDYEDFYHAVEMLIKLIDEVKKYHV